MLKKAGAEQAKPRNDTAKIRGSHEREVGRQEDKLSRPRWHSGTITPSLTQLRAVLCPVGQH